MFDKYYLSPLIKYSKKNAKKENKVGNFSPNEDLLSINYESFGVSAMASVLVAYLKRDFKKAKKSEPTQMEKCNEYERYRRELDRFSFKYNEEETKKVLKRMTEYANDTIPEGYNCKPNDSWKIWFGPSEKSLLINTTRRVAFKVDRGWWQKHYQTTIYVDRELDCWLY